MIKEKDDIEEYLTDYPRILEKITNTFIIEDNENWDFHERKSYKVKDLLADLKKLEYLTQKAKPKELILDLYGLRCPNRKCNAYYGQYYHERHCMKCGQTLEYNEDYELEPVQCILYSCSKDKWLNRGPFGSISWTDELSEAYKFTSAEHAREVLKKLEENLIQPDDLVIEEMD